jgi:RNA polymerase sigma factor (TIGR02999 family)
MTTPSQQEVTELLLDWGGGDRAALDKLLPLVYEELRRMAHRYMNRERLGHTLQTTSLVNEAYLKLCDQTRVRWQNRAHFFAIAAQTMRRILVDHARAQGRAKRGGGVPARSLDEGAHLSPSKAAELIALDDALNSLAQLDERRSRVVELRFFGGLSNEEIAEVLDISPNTVTRDWNMAKAWLYKEVAGRG